MFLNIELIDHKSPITPVNLVHPPFTKAPTDRNKHGRNNVIDKMNSLNLNELVWAECMRYVSPNTVATINIVTSPPLSSLLLYLSMCLRFSQNDIT